MGRGGRETDGERREVGRETDREIREGRGEKGGRQMGTEGR